MPSYVKREKQEAIAGLKWQTISPDYQGRCVLLEITGASNSGRTYWSLMTAPGPIALIDSREKIDGLINRVVRERGIRLERIPFGNELRGKTSDVQRTAIESRNLAEAAMTDAYRWAKTIVVDTHNSLWETHQLARLGTLERADRDEKTQRKGQLVYSVINARFRSMWKEFRRMRDLHNRTNLIVIGETKPIYVSAGPDSNAKKESSKREPHRQKHLFQDMDVVVTRVRNKDNTFTLTINKPWFNEDVQDVELTGNASRFPELMSLITTTNKEEWR
jgi:hypothetical protein